MNIIDDMRDLLGNLMVTYGRFEVAKAINRSETWVRAQAGGNHVLKIDEDFIDGLHRMGYDIALVKIDKTDDGTRKYKPVKFKNSSREEKERFNDLV